jgi:hypothetical protein
MYKICLNKDPSTGVVSEPCIVIKDNKLWIPFNPDNTDYQAYLRWCEEGNTPEPAEGAE